MKKFWLTVVAIGLFSGFAAAQVSGGSSFMQSKTKFKPAPIHEILNGSTLCPSCPEFSITEIDKRLKEDYEPSIVRSFTFKKVDLVNLLQQGYQTLNQETKQIINIKNNLPNASPAYRFANYQLAEQISQQITQRNKQYKKLKKELNRILKKITDDEDIYLIEARDPFFFHHNRNWDNHVIGGYWDKVTYVSIFNKKYKHLLTYNRTHLDVLKNRQIATPTGSITDENAAYLYQQLFDDYISDLTRIGKGLDINNPRLLRQLGEMQDKVHTLKLK